MLGAAALQSVKLHGGAESSTLLRPVAYLFISHDLRVVRALASELIVMKDGVAVERGPARRVFAELEEAYTRELMAAAFEIETLDSGGGG